MPFFHSAGVFGVDIGTTSIKAVELTRVGDEIRLTNYGILSTFEHANRSTGAIQTANLRFLEPVVVRLLKTLMRKMNARPARIVASVPSFSVFTTVIELPKMSREEAARAMPFQSAQYIPAPVATVSIEWVPVGERELANGTHMQQFFLSSMPLELIEKYRAVFRSAGLPLYALEVEDSARARALSVMSDEPALILDIGSRSTSISIAAGGLLYAVSQTDFSGAALTQVLAQGLGIAPWRAEHLKISRGLQGRGGEQELSTLLKPILNVILNEAKRAAMNFMQSSGRPIRRVILAGGTAALLGLKEYAAEEFALAVDSADPFAAISFPKELAEDIRAFGPELSVAAGLALRLV